MILIVGLAIGIFFVMRYAERVKKDPSKSVVYDMKAENEARFRGRRATTASVALTGTQKVILAVFGLAFVVMIYGVIPWEDLGIPFPTWWWWFPEMTASFLLFAIIIGLIGRMREGELTTSFVDGARDLLGVALIIGIARGITVIMNNGQITDTVLHWVENALGDTGEVAFAIVMFLLFLPLSFLIPSSSGLATLSMPIMAPLAGFVGVVGSAGRDRLPERLGRDEPVHPDVRRRHGRPGDRPRPLRHLPALGLAAARAAQRRWSSSCSRSRRRSEREEDQMRRAVEWLLIAGRRRSWSSA